MLVCVAHFVYIWLFSLFSFKRSYSFGHFTRVTSSLLAFAAYLSCLRRIVLQVLARTNKSRNRDVTYYFFQ